MKKEYVIITTASNDKETVTKITEALLEERLVSYVQESKRFSSYWWKGKIVREEEYILTMGTKKSLFNEVKQKIEEIHNYQVPAITMCDIIGGNESIFNWMEEETKNI